MKLERSLQQWAGGKASVIAEGSKAQVMYFIEDAQKDIATLAAEISRLQSENADLRSGEYLARVVEERDRMREAHDLVSDWIVEGTEDLPDDTPVTIKIGSRSIILDELKNLRAALSPSSTTGEAE